MNPPGWYPDPAGVPNRLRFWDGSTWAEATTYDPGTPFPAPGQTAPATGQPGQPGQPVEGKSKLLVPLIAGGVALVLLVVAGIFFVPRLLGGGDDPVDPPTNPPTAPSAPPTDGQGSSPGQQGSPGQGGGCTGGNGVALPQGPVFTSGGATVTTPDTWTWRYDKSYWTWQDDSGAWGRILEDEEDYGLGMALGSLHERNGFTDPQSAVDAQLKCITTHGMFNDPAVNKWTETGSEAFEAEGLTGWKKTGTMTHTPGTKYESMDLTIIVVDAGQPATKATLVTFNPTGYAEGAAEIEQLMGTFKKH
ncbi:DUF2510 domain-containing protein [Propionibacteriaceae bacterium Y1685]